MLNYYQPFLLPFLGRKKHFPPAGVKQLFYHSFEDGLWQLLWEKGIPQGSTILVPDFYCMDVLENFENHGFQWQMYKLNGHFQIPENEFLAKVRQVKPTVIVIFHACGITSQLLQKIDWLDQIDSDVLIIEDGVHRLVNPELVKLIDDRHFLIDSLRKDSPLSGSFIYGTEAGLNFQPSRVNWFSGYLIKSSLSFLLFRLILQLGFKFRWGKLVELAHTSVLKFHDDIIGDSLKSHAGLPWIPWIHRYFNFAKVEKIKQTQVKVYQNLFKQYLAENPFFYQVNIPEADRKLLHVFALGCSQVDPQLEDWLHSHNLPIWFKFPDCQWSKHRGVLFLPLGFHVQVREMEKLFALLASYQPKKVADL